MRPTIRTRRRPFRGVTLLEALFAIGIAGVGLIGVGILLPMAGKAVRDGTLADRAAVIAEDSYREMKTRGYLQPHGWWIMTSDTTAERAMPSYVSSSPNTPPYYPSATPVVPGCPICWNHQRAFCIDPWFVAHNSNSTAFSTAGVDPRLFPHYSISGTSPRLLRVTLPNFTPNTVAGSATSSTAFSGIPVSLGTSGTSPASYLLGLESARNVFISPDDLRFDLPANKMLAPQQTFFSSGGVGTGKRQSEDNLSWFVTVVPRGDAWYGALQANPMGSFEGIRSMDYTISVVVCANRGAAIEMRDAAVVDSQESRTNSPQKLDEERVAGITFQWNNGGSGGIGGGEVFIENIGHQLTTLRRGHWIMLARHHQPTGSPQPPINSSGIAPTLTIAGWYRVLAVSDADETGPSGAIGRYATIAGADWYPDARFTTQVFIVPRVVAVFDRTVKLEVSGIW